MFLFKGISISGKILVGEDPEAQLTERKNICNYTMEGFTSRIYKQVKKLGNSKNKPSSLNWAKGISKPYKRMKFKWLKNR